MIFLLSALYHLTPSPTCALPLNLSSLVVSANTPLPTCYCPDIRSLASIIWSCFATVFTCTWVAIHPNIPAPTDSFWMMSRRRTGLMLCAIIAPELVLYWAMRQRSAAWRLGEKYKRYGWSPTHGFWLQMGGFYLCRKVEDAADDSGIQATTGEMEAGKEDEEVPIDPDLPELPPKPPSYEFIEVLSPEIFHDLLRTKRISFPSISASDIEDKSKGDGLAKGFVVLQTTWFVVQCVARGVQKLPVSQLEIATVAFAALNGVVYYVWWDKPLDVRYGVGIVLEKEEDNEDSEKRSISEPVVSNATNERSEEQVHGEDRPSTALEGDGLSSILLSATSGGQDFPPMESQVEGATRSPTRLDARNPNNVLEEPPSTQDLETASSGSQKPTSRSSFRQFFVQSIETRGLPITILYILFYLPIRTLFVAPFGSLTLEKRVPSSARRVPTFYAADFAEGSHTQTNIILLSLFIGTVFGSVHLIAWKFAFDSAIEKWLWRSAACVVTVMPVVFVAFLVLIGTVDEWEYVQVLGKYGFGLLFTAYSLARLILIVVVLIELRGLDDSDRLFLDIDWMKFVPHI